MREFVSMTGTPEGSKAKSKSEVARLARQAAELRANIAKRKAQARARAEPDKADTGADPETTGETGSR